MILLAFEVFTVFLTAIAMSLALAHALEYPGKLRLDEQTYTAVQAIYYPGFTIGGIAEPVAAIAVLVLLVIMRDRSAQFPWLLTAFLALAAMHVVFWSATPVNRYWLKDQKLAKPEPSSSIPDTLTRRIEVAPAYRTGDRFAIAGSIHTLRVHSCRQLL